MARNAVAGRRRRPQPLAIALTAGLVVSAAVVAVSVLPSQAASVPEAGGAYTLVAGASGKCLEVPSSSTSSGTLLTQAACAAGATRQQWRVVANSGSFNVVNVNSGQCVDVPSGSTTSGLQLQQWGCAAAQSNQLWRFTASTAAAGKYVITSVGTGLCVSDLDGSTAGNNPIVQETCSDIARMQWSFNLVSAPPTTAPTTPPPTGGGPPTNPPNATSKQMEDLNRGLISVRSGSNNFVSWRMLGTDPASVSFNLYRGGTKVNGSPITNSTNFLDSGAAAGSSYTVRPVVNGVEQAASEASMNWGQNFLDVPISPPAGGTTPDGVAYTYTANDASVGDLDGDGQYEIVLKWDPTNSKDNSQSGYTGDVFVDALRLNGTRLWRIDLGRNIRAGAHYTQFQVYDYDGDGRAEVAMKTADGSRSGTGQVIGNASADFRNTSGYILSGPEFLTMFNGLTGAILSTVNYEPARGTVSSWGDSYGNRVDRFLAGTAFLDGQRPSLIVSRGYYTRTVIVAYDFRNGALTRRWIFDSNTAGSQYTDQGDHQLAIGDLDQDGRDEIVFGAMAINDNGAPLWNTDNRHGDALHVGDLIPSRAGLEVFKVDENTDQPADWMADARTGAIIWQHASCGCDNGRGVSDDIWSGSAGAESWSSAVANLTSSTGAVLGRKPGSQNFLIYWDADPVRELLDGTHIDKYGTSSDTRLLTGADVHSNNSTKSTPTLSADLFGDWREEVIWPTTSNTALRIYTTTTVTSTRIFTLMQDPMYRMAIAWQNTAYNQPPHPGFFIGNGMSTPPQPNIYVR